MTTRLASEMSQRTRDVQVHSGERLLESGARSACGLRIDVTPYGRRWPFKAIDDASKAFNRAKLKPSVMRDGQ